MLKRHETHKKSVINSSSSTLIHKTLGKRRKFFKRKINKIHPTDKQVVIWRNKYFGVSSSNSTLHYVNNNEENVLDRINKFAIGDFQPKNTIRKKIPQEVLQKFFLEYAVNENINPLVYIANCKRNKQESDRKRCHFAYMMTAKTDSGEHLPDQQPVHTRCYKPLVIPEFEDDGDEWHASSKPYVPFKVPDDPVYHNYHKTDQEIMTKPFPKKRKFSIFSRLCCKKPKPVPESKLNLTNSEANLATKSMQTPQTEQTNKKVQVLPSYHDICTCCSRFKVQKSTKTELTDKSCGCDTQKYNKLTYAGAKCDHHASIQNSNLSQNSNRGNNGSVCFDKCGNKSTNNQSQLDTIDSKVNCICKKNNCNKNETRRSVDKKLSCCSCGRNQKEPLNKDLFCNCPLINNCTQTKNDKAEHDVDFYVKSLMDTDKKCKCKKKNGAFTNKNTIVIPPPHHGAEKSNCCEVTETLKCLIKMESRQNSRNINAIITEMNKQKKELKKLKVVCENLIQYNKSCGSQEVLQKEINLECCNKEKNGREYDYENEMEPHRSIYNKMDEYKQYHVTSISTNHKNPLMIDSYTPNTHNTTTNTSPNNHYNHADNIPVRDAAGALHNPIHYGNDLGLSPTTPGHSRNTPQAQNFVSSPHQQGYNPNTGQAQNFMLPQVNQGYPSNGRNAAHPQNDGMCYYPEGDYGRQRGYVDPVTGQYHPGSNDKCLDLCFEKFVKHAALLDHRSRPEYQPGQSHAKEDNTEIHAGSRNNGDLNLLERKANSTIISSEYNNDGKNVKSKPSSPKQEDKQSHYQQSKAVMEDFKDKTKNGKKAQKEESESEPEDKTDKKKKGGICHKIYKYLLSKLTYK